MTPEVQKKVAEVNGQLAALPDPILSINVVRLLIAAGFRVGPGDLEGDGRVEPLARAIGANSPWSAGAMAGPDTDLTTIREKWSGLTAFTATLGEGRTPTRFVLSPRDRTLKEYVVRQGVTAKLPPPEVASGSAPASLPPAVALPSSEEGIIQVAAWLDEKKVATAAVSEATAFVASIHKDVGQLGDQLERKLNEVAEQARDAYLNGEDPPEDDPSKRKKVQAIKLKESAAKSALPLAEARIVEAKRALESIEARTSPAIDLVGARVQAALESIGAALDAIVPDIEVLVMSDIVREHLVGSKFSTSQPNHPGLLSGRILATAFLKNLPAKLRPSAGIEDVTKNAAQRAAELIQKIEEARNV